MRRGRPHHSLLLGLAALTGCQTTFEGPSRNPAFIQVSLAESQETGTAENPLPFSSESVEVSVIVETLDSEGEPWPFSGVLTAAVRPAKFEGNPWIEVTDGRWEGSVTIRNGYGPTRVWFSDKGDMSSGEVEPTWATGVSDPIHYEFPTIAEMNRHDDPETNNLAGEFAELRIEDRQVVVTAVGTSGFWVTDMMDEPGGYNSLFIYSFSAPEPEIQLGRRLTLLTGANQEYLATTQLSFPTYEVSDEEPVTPPAASDISEFCGDEMDLEGYESALVTATGAKIPTNFGADPNDEDYLDYINYGQWPVVLPSGCTFYVDSSVPCPGFRPTAGVELPGLTGLLNQVWDKAIFLIRDGNDLPAGLCDGDAAGPPTPSRPLPREAPLPRRLQ